MNRQEAIDRLVENEIDTIETQIREGDYTLIDSIVRSEGISGFENLCSEDLMQEYFEVFEEEIYLKL